MRFRVIRGSIYDSDLIRHYVTIGMEHPQAAENFRSAADQVLKDLSDFPESGREFIASDSPGSRIRVRVLPRYRILLIYQFDGETVVMLRALHGARGDIADAVREALRGE